MKKVTALWFGFLVGSLSVFTGLTWWVGRQYETWELSMYEALFLAVQSMTTTGWAVEPDSTPGYILLFAMEKAGILAVVFTVILVGLWALHLSGYSLQRDPST